MTVYRSRAFRRHTHCLIRVLAVAGVAVLVGIVAAYLLAA